MQEHNHPENQDIDFDKFWSDFAFYPSKITEKIFKNPWYLSLIILAPYLAINTPIYYKNWHDLGDIDYWIYADTTKEWTVIVIGYITIIWAFHHWRLQIPRIFNWLFDNYRISSEVGVLEKMYYQYLIDYQKELFRRRKRFVFVIVAGVIILVYRLYNPHGPIQYLLALIIYGLCSGLASWPFYVTGRFISKLPHRFDLNIQPSHPDKCGGLKPLGDFCFAMVMPIVIFELMLVAFGIGGAILLSAFPEVSLIIGQREVIFAYVTLFVIALPSTLFSFLLPLRDVHTDMVKHKTEQEEAYAVRVSNLEQQIRDYLDREDSVEEARKAKERLEILQTIHPDRLGYPVWPFQRNVILKLASPQILGILGTVFNVYQNLADFLE